MHIDIYVRNDTHAVLAPRPLRTRTRTRTHTLKWALNMHRYTMSTHLYIHVRACTQGCTSSGRAPEPHVCARTHSRTHALAHAHSQGSRCMHSCTHTYMSTCIHAYIRTTVYVHSDTQLVEARLCLRGPHPRTHFHAHAGMHAAHASIRMHAHTRTAASTHMHTRMYLVVRV